MAPRTPKTLSKLLLSYELSFLALILVTAAVGGAWVYSWHRSAMDIFQINSLLYQTQALRADLYRQVREVYQASRAREARALDLYWNHIYEIDRRFYALDAQVTRDDEREALGKMRNSYTMLQTQLNQLLSGSLSGDSHDRVIQPAYESWLRGGFETAFTDLQERLNHRRQGINERLGRFNRIALWLFPVPLLIAAAVLLASRMRLRKDFALPMRNLRQGAGEIAQGNFDHRVEASGTEETATLARTINQMAADLAASRDALVEKEKQAAMGALVPVVAHNIRNPLASIRATAQVIERDDSGEEFDNSKRSILESVDRLERWVSALLSYLNPLTPHTVTARLDAVLEGALTPLTQRIRDKDIVIERQNFDCDCSLEIDVDLMEQALHGIILNAVEASPSGGRIVIALGRQEDELTITVDDAGPGMAFAPDPKDLRPGPTTKSSGTGLGIPFAHKVCRSHGGRLDFDCAPGTGGARVRITLPRRLTDKKPDHD